MNALKCWLMRKGFRLASRLYWRKSPTRPVAVQDLSMPVEGGVVALRVYRPEAAGAVPLMLYFHGGGFMVGDLDTHDALCRQLCAGSGYLVLAVDYRLAPEHVFPAAAEDALAALRWALAHAGELGVDSAQIVLAGDSAGGNLAAVTALQARDLLPGVVKGQVLLYPMADHYVHGGPSYSEFAKGATLTRGMMVDFWDCYYRNSPLLAPGQTRHPLATPLAVENLVGLPPALVITAGRDPLRDEGLAYARRLAEQGVAVRHCHYPDAPHGFIGTMGPIAEHEQGVADILGWLSGLKPCSAGRE